MNGQKVVVVVDDDVAAAVDVVVAAAAVVVVKSRSTIVKLSTPISCFKSKFGDRK